jgi:hypothetical protein
MLYFCIGWGFNGLERRKSGPVVDIRSKTGPVLTSGARAFPGPAGRPAPRARLPWRYPRADPGSGTCPPDARPPAGSASVARIFVGPGLA